jgi:hypothetical protein
MKKIIAAGCGFVLLLLAACENPAGSDMPSGSNTGKGRISGEQLYLSGGVRYTGSGTVELWAETNGGGAERKTIGTVSEGTMAFTLPDLDGGNYRWHTVLNTPSQSVTVTPAEAQSVSSALVFIESGSNNDYSLLRRGNETYDGATYTGYEMGYVYVDRNVSLNGSEVETDDSQGSSYIITETYSKVSLKKGWNAVYIHTSSTSGASGGAITHTVSASSKSGLKWIIE